MNTAKGRLVDRSPRRTGVELSHEALDADIRQASAGDAKAAGRLLSRLASEDRTIQSKVTAAVLALAEKGFWAYLLEFGGLGTWAGQRTSLPASVSVNDLRPNLTALFLTRPDRPTAADRMDVLVAGLSGSNPAVRRFAVDLLRQWRGRVDPQLLVPLLHDPDAGVRLRAARALGKIGDPRSVDALLEVLTHADDLVAGEASDALARMGAPAMDRLMAALLDKNRHVRWHAAKALAEMANPAAAGALVSALDDDDFGVRWLAASGLSAIGTPALFSLLDALRTRDITPWLAEGAIHVLKNSRDPLIIPLVDELEKRLWDAYADVVVPIEADRVLNKLKEAYGYEAGSL